MKGYMYRNLIKLKSKLHLILTARVSTLNIKCRRQILTSKVDSCTERVKYLSWSYTHNMDLQMKQIESNKTLMMLSN